MLPPSLISTEIVGIRQTIAESSYSTECPLWVKSRRIATILRMSAFGGKADLNSTELWPQISHTIPLRLLLIAIPQG